jgi:hypothetical protein
VLTINLDGTFRCMRTEIAAMSNGGAGGPIRIASRRASIICFG